jgi:uncharacterized ferredoxin-like protein
MSRKARRREQEAEAIRDVARLMLEWAARLGPKSRAARELERIADEALAHLTAIRR